MSTTIASATTRIVCVREARINAVIAERYGEAKRGYLLNNVPQHWQQHAQSKGGSKGGICFVHSASAVRQVVGQERQEERKRLEIASRVGCREQKIPLFFSSIFSEAVLPTPHPLFNERSLTALLTVRFRFLLPFYNVRKRVELRSLTRMNMQDDLQDGELGKRS